MTLRDTAWPEGTPAWVDLMVADPKRAAEFYGALLGWRFEDQGEEYGHYTIATLEGRAVAAVGPLPPAVDDQGAAWTTYLAVADVDKTTAKISEAGGQVLLPPGDVGDSGRMALAADPTGAAFGLWQAKGHIGAGIANVPGTLVWNECMTRDFDAAKAFYGRVFGYRFEDLSGDGFVYAALNVDDRTVGGLGQLPPEVPARVPPHWSVYFGVTDTDEALTKAESLGARRLTDPQDSPYGRMAQVLDDQGVPFTLIAVEP
ncbi:VOC family protein [Amycolatopsis sp. 3B14]|uniref:VOC family protein n=1 Tax=Amycolatopsis sp. 3B14 TaxID=3243600 RepID=UPI003D972C9E